MARHVALSIFGGGLFGFFGGLSGGPRNERIDPYDIAPSSLCYS